MTLPYKIGDNGPEITAFEQWFNRVYHAYAPAVDGYYGDPDAAATKELQRRLGLPQTGIFDAVTATKAGFAPGQVLNLPGPVPGKRHLAVVFRGIGGIIGLDYVSRVCQAVPGLVEEVNPAWAATMGGIPVGAAGSPTDLSMQHGIDAALVDAKRIINDAIAANPKRKVIIGGYSAGAVVAAFLRQWFLATYPSNYLCSFSLGDPTRPVGGAYYLASKVTAGRGISSFHFGDIHDYRHCWLAQPGDMYTSVPNDATGDIMQTVYDIVTNVQLTDPLGTAKAMITNLPTLLEETGISLPAALKTVTGAVAKGDDPTALETLALNLAITNLVGLFGAALDPHSKSIVAAGKAAILGIQFIAAQPPTAPHITYEFGEVWPGQTYLGLAIQHVRDFANSVLPT